MLHVVPTLGKVRLAKLSAQQVQTLYAAKLEAGLSSTTVHHIGTVLHGALAKAERLGLVARNVCELADLPRMADREIHVLKPEQVRVLLDAVADDRLEALYVLAVTTGMRQGELLALRWRDVDLGRGTLSIQATLQRTKEHGYIFAAPKTRHSQRQITLSQLAITALRRHRIRQDVERLASSAVAEELAAHILIQEAETLLHERGEAADFGPFKDDFFEDVDFEFLFSGAFDGVEETTLGQELGIVNLAFGDWFKRFGSPGSADYTEVHPYVRDDDEEEKPS